MTYVMSDIHGCYKEYCKMLEKITFSGSDDLYIIGDVIDRGPDVVPLLEDIMARDNVRLLAGNHEYMGLRVLGAVCKKDGLTTLLDDLSAADLEACPMWTNDGGSQTLSQLKRGGDELLRRTADFLAELPLYEEVSAGGREFLLIHAGLEPFQPGKPLEDYGPAELLFHRADYSRPYFPDRYTITGHTPTFFSGGDGHILRRNNHIAIDCGCVYGYRLGEEETHTPTGLRVFCEKPTTTWRCSPSRKNIGVSTARRSCTFWKN